MGAGLRLTMELLGPEYSLTISTLDTSTKVFLSRRLQGNVAEDLIEKQNAEQGSDADRRQRIGRVRLRRTRIAHSSSRSATVFSRSRIFAPGWKSSSC